MARLACAPVMSPPVPAAVVQTQITPPLEIDSYFALDLYASVSNGDWSIRSYVKNATDERGYSSIGTVSSALTGVTEHLNAVPIQPRTFGVQVDYTF